MIIIMMLLYVSFFSSSSSRSSYEYYDNKIDNNIPQNKKKQTTNSSSLLAFASFLSFQGFEGCYLASNFIDSAAKLGVSWRRTTKNKKWDMLLLVVDAPCRHLYSLQRLRDIGWRIVWVKAPIWYTPKTNERGWSWIAGNRYEHTSQFSKLFLWNLIQYKHIFYMDSDILLMRDPMQYISPLISSFARSSSLGMDHCNPNICNHTTKRVCDTADCCAGAMLITPSAFEFQRMLHYIPVVTFDRELQEQSFLQHYWTPQYNRVTFGFPRLIIPTPSEQNDNNNGSAVGIHFIGNWKPWQSLLAQEYPLLKQWWHGYCGYASCI